MKLSEEAILQFGKHLRSGLARRHCAALAGLGWGSVGRWLARGSEAMSRESDGHPVTGELDRLCMMLVCEVEVAEATFAQVQMGKIEESAAAAVRLKLLQIRYPELYGEVRRSEVSVGVDDSARATLEETLAALNIPFDNPE